MVRDDARVRGSVKHKHHGGFDFDLEFAPESAAGSGASAPAGNGASLFTALEEQLGLKLRPARALLDVLVIDRVDRPTEN